MSKEFACLRPNVGDDILCDEEVFTVHAIALQAGENKVLAKVTHGSGNTFSERKLREIGFFSVGE
jgi:hypothetical protein